MSKFTTSQTIPSSISLNDYWDQFKSALNWMDIPTSTGSYSSRPGGDDGQGLEGNLADPFPAPNVSSSAPNTSSAQFSSSGRSSGHSMSSQQDVIVTGPMMANSQMDFDSLDEPISVTLARDLKGIVTKLKLVAVPLSSGTVYKCVVKVGCNAFYLIR